MSVGSDVLVVVLKASSTNIDSGFSVLRYDRGSEKKFERGYWATLLGRKDKRLPRMSIPELNFCAASRNPVKHLGTVEQGLCLSQNSFKVASECRHIG